MRLAEGSSSSSQGVHVGSSSSAACINTPPSTTSNNIPSCHPSMYPFGTNHISFNIEKINSSERKIPEGTHTPGTLQNSFDAAFKSYRGNQSNYPQLQPQPQFANARNKLSLIQSRNETLASPKTTTTTSTLSTASPSPTSLITLTPTAALPSISPSTSTTTTVITLSESSEPSSPSSSSSLTSNPSPKSKSIFWFKTKKDSEKEGKGKGKEKEKTKDSPASSKGRNGKLLIEGPQTSSPPAPKTLFMRLLSSPTLEKKVPSSSSPLDASARKVSRRTSAPLLGSPGEKIQAGLGPFRNGKPFHGPQLGIGLFGTGESGKSTLYKQLQYLAKKTVKIQEQCYQDILWSNTVQAFQRLIHALYDLEIPLYDPELEIEREKVAGLSQYYPIEVSKLIKMRPIIKKFWKNRSIRECYCRSSGLQLLTSTKY